MHSTCLRQGSAHTRDAVRFAPPEVDGFHSPDGIALSKRFLSLGARFPKPLLLLAFPVVANLRRLIHFEHRSGREAGRSPWRHRANDLAVAHGQAVPER